MKYNLTIFFFFLFSNVLLAQNDNNNITQQRDSVQEKNSTDSVFKNPKDTIPKTIKKIFSTTAKTDTIKKPIEVLKDTFKSSSHLKIADSFYLSTTGLSINKAPVFMIEPEIKLANKNSLFYASALLLLLLAIIRIFFNSYFQKTINLFFQTTGINAKTKYIAQQDEVASILMLLVFLISGGVYTAILAAKFLKLDFSFWETMLFSFVALFCVYASKFLLLRFLGWAFNLQVATRLYLFLIFLVNRILGVVLTPVIILLSFSKKEITDVVFIISIILLILFFIYRYILTLKIMQPNIRAKSLQIFIYLCGVEILPIMLLYKFLLNYMNGLY